MAPRGEEGKAFARPAEGSPAAPPSDDVFAKIDALLRAGEGVQAERLLEQHVAQGAPRPAAYFRMGQVYFALDAWSKAAEFLKESLALDPQNDQAHLLLGLAWRQLHKPEKAEWELREAARLNPQSDQIAYFAGHQLLLMEKYEAALAYLYKAVELDPRRSEAFRALGMAQAHLGNYGLAESYYRKAVDIAGPSVSADAVAHADLAFLLLIGHDPAKLAEGLEHARKAARLDPASGDAHYLIGKALFKLGRVPEAVAELQESAKSNSQDIRTYFLLARAFDQLGRKEDAARARSRFVALKRRPPKSGMASGSAFKPRED